MMQAHAIAIHDGRTHARRSVDIAQTITNHLSLHSHVCLLSRVGEQLVV